MEYLIPVERGTAWNQERALGSLPPGTRYTVAEYEPGEYQDAVNEGVRRSSSETVFLAAPDAWVDRDPDTLSFLEDLAWNADVTYGPLIHWADGAPRWTQAQEHFCPNRLYRENYLPQLACVKRESFLAIGGLKTGMWDYYVRAHEAGQRIKHVPEACSARDDPQPDPSPRPEAKEVLATFYYQATPGTAYWRCLLPARHLPGQAIFNHPYRVQDDKGNMGLPQHAGAAVFQFGGDDSHYLLTKYLQSQGVRVLIEVDDNYTRWFPEHMKRAGWTETIEDSRNGNGYSVEGHVKTVELADGVICTTLYLAKQYRKHNENVYVCGNHIDPDDWPAVEKPDDGVFRIGWFASGSHRYDGDLIERALTWAGKQPDVEIVMMGVGAGATGPWWKSFPYKHIAWSSDMAVYRRFLLEFDVNLCPIVGTPWAVCRSDLKALEGAAAQALSIVSDQPPYETLEMPHARRCKTPKDWLRAIQWACANRDEVRAQAKEAREWTLEHRTIQKRVTDWNLAIAA